MARRPRNARAHPHLLPPYLIVPLGGSIAAACFRPRLPLDWEFATDGVRTRSPRSAAVRSLGYVPVIAISSGDQTPAVTAARQALAGLSSHGRVVFAWKSSHWVPYDEPELIAEAIREVAEIFRHT